MSNSIGLTIPKLTLINALGNIQSVVNNKVVLPILGNVKLDAEDGKLTLTCTDMDITVSTIIEADIDVEGTLTIPAKNLYDIVKRMPEESIISIRGDADVSGQVQIKSKGCRFKLSCIKSDDFPILTRGDMSCEFELEANKLLKLINNPRVAMSTNEVQYNLCGINLRSDNKTIVATATNGHKLNKTIVDIDAEIVDFPNVILPTKLIGLVSKLLDKPTINVKVMISDVKICIEYDNTILVSKLIDGKFPDTTNILPTELINRMDINREFIIQAISRVSLACNFKTNEISFSVVDGVLTISAQSAENGTGEEDIEIETDFATLERKFNAKYLIEILSNIDSENVIFYFNDSQFKPVTIHGANADKEVYLIMAING